jgi:crotonobetainyl-CoA:carnitine CoA-transferase CaiB-like acyl-CoA transferase
VYCSISAFGQTGPYRDRPAHDLVCEALAGVVSLNLGGDGEPTLPPLPAADFAGASLALSGILMALFRRERTGAGDRIDISMHDSVLAWLGNVVGPVFAEKRDLVPRHERSLGGAAFYNIYRTKDGRHVVLGAQEPKFVRALLTEWGRPDLIDTCLSGPGPHQRPVIDFLQEVFARRTQLEWVDWFDRRDIGFGPVRTLREVFDDPHVRARAMRLVDGLGQEHIGLPVKYACEPGHANFTLAQPGEHTADVLRECGYDDRALVALRSDGAW